MKTPAFAVDSLAAGAAMQWTETAGARHPEITPDRFDVLFVGGLSEDLARLRTALRRIAHVMRATTCEDALRQLRDARIPIVLCDDRLPDGTWLNVFNGVATDSDTPLLIVTARCADERLWAEVLNLGGFDLLAKPFRAAEVRHVVKTAWRRLRTLAYGQYKGAR